MPGRKADSFSLYDDLLAAAPASDPWTHTAAETPAYEPDYGLLGELLTIPVRASALSESGIFAKGIDSWMAHELRRAGFAADEIWPRPRRVLEVNPIAHHVRVRSLLERRAIAVPEADRLP
jgi:hypothetical protein